MNMKRPSRYSETEDQATGTVLIVRIIFDNFSGPSRFMQFMHANAALNTLIDRVARKLKKSVTKLCPDLLDHL
jgi:hypothetical protein